MSMAPTAGAPPSPSSTRNSHGGDPHGRGPRGSHVAQPRVSPRSHSRHLAATRDDEVHDLVCVGFGPASLAIAVALHDALQAQADDGWGAGDGDGPKVRFLERQPSFQWHGGMLLPGAKMQISFIKDLATLRDPTSAFTFLNYLHQHGRLVEFANLGTFLPSRLEFDDYLQWAAAHFAHVVAYDQHVDAVRPRKVGPGDKFDCFEVVSRSVSTGERRAVLGRNVVIAAGGRPARPAVFPAAHAKILHSSEYRHRIAAVLPDPKAAYTIAVVGGGQSGAEVFHDLQARYPRAHTRLVIRDTALRPSDDSPFVNELFHPGAVDAFFAQPDQERARALDQNKATNYSVVRLELLERIYDDLYVQHIKQPDRWCWQHQILPSREITAVADHGPGRPVQLTLAHVDPLCPETCETILVDAVVLATGYRRDAHVDMLRDCESLNTHRSGRWQAGRDYGLPLDADAVEAGVGLWLQGCNETTHGLSDSLLSILSTRSGELVESIWGQHRRLHPLPARSLAQVVT